MEVLTIKLITVFTTVSAPLEGLSSAVLSIPRVFDESFAVDLRVVPCTESASSWCRPTNCVSSFEQDLVVVTSSRTRHLFTVGASDSLAKTASRMHL